MINYKRKKLSIVVVGWHFKNSSIYKKLMNETELYNNLEVKCYIASHKKKIEIDENIIDHFARSKWKLLYFKNEGWDWGAYQQFLIWQKNNTLFSDYYLFLHDDIEIKNSGFIKVFIEQIQNGAKVVGNGIECSSNNHWKLTHPEIISWSQANNFPIEINAWRWVRGSCFFTTRSVARDILTKMPIKKGASIRLGNWSEIIFAGLVTSKYGEKSIEYIGKSQRKSFYIEEEERGKTNNTLVIMLKNMKSRVLNKIKSLVLFQ